MVMLWQGHAFLTVRKIRGMSADAAATHFLSVPCENTADVDFFFIQ
jgi:hypothetical protein